MVGVCSKFMHWFSEEFALISPPHLKSKAVIDMIDVINVLYARVACIVNKFRKPVSQRDLDDFITVETVFHAFSQIPRFSLIYKPFPTIFHSASRPPTLFIGFDLLKA